MEVNFIILQSNACGIQAILKHLLQVILSMDGLVQYLKELDWSDLELFFKKFYKIICQGGTLLIKFFVMINDGAILEVLYQFFKSLLLNFQKPTSRIV